MGMYNSSRAAMNPAAMQQQSWGGQRAAMPQPMSTMGGGSYGTSPSQGIQNARPMRMGGLQNSLSRPSQTANMRQNYAAQQLLPDAGGVVAPQMQQPQMQQGPSLEQIQAEMARRNVGAQLNANPANSALSGYLMGQ